MPAAVSIITQAGQVSIPKVVIRDILGVGPRDQVEFLSDDFEVILAARDAQLHDDIVKLPDGYQHKLNSGGRNLSDGQRQRMEIARVLVQDPTIIIMDEATSALDARTEYEVVKNIQRHRRHLLLPATAAEEALHTRPASVHEGLHLHKRPHLGARIDAGGYAGGTYSAAAQPCAYGPRAFERP